MTDEEVQDEQGLDREAVDAPAPENGPEPGRQPSPESDAQTAQTAHDPTYDPAEPTAHDTGHGNPHDPADATAHDPGLEQQAKQALVEPVVVPRWIQLVLLPLAIVGLFELARATGSLLLIVIAAIMIAIILNPMVKRFRRHMPIAVAILLGWVVVWLLLAAVIVALAAPLATQLTHITSEFPLWVDKANKTLQNLQNFLDRNGIKVHIAGQGQNALQSIEKRLLKSTGSVISFSSDVLGRLVSLSIDFILTFVLSIYFLAYSSNIAELVRRWMPPGDGSLADDYPTLVQKAVSGYVRAQLLFSLIMGASCAAILWLLGVIGIFPDGQRFAVFFGLFYALMELIPYIGPIVGAIPPMLVALATRPIAALWLLIVFVALQQLEGHVVAPQLFRIGLRINPILVILALLIGQQLFGIAGALLALPVATVIRQTIIYLRAHTVLEKWNTTPPI